MKRSPRVLALFAFVVVVFSFSTAAAKDNWLQVKSRNFTLVGNASEKDIRKVATRLEQFRETFRLLFKQAKLATDTPTTVVVFKSDGSYKQFKPKRGDGKIDEFVAGYFMPGDDVNYITLAVGGEDHEVFNTIFHESVHAFVNANFGKSEVPTWFNEGLAEYYSTFEIEQDQKVKLGLPQDIHLELLSQSQLIPLDTLFNLSNQQMQAGGSHSRSIFYAQSWAIMHYLIRNGKGAQLGQFLNLVMKDKPADKAFQEAFQMDFKAFEKELKKYINQSTYQYQIITFNNKLVFENEMTTTPLDDAGSSYRLGDLLAHTNRHDDAEPFLLNALKTDPTSTGANTALGFVKIRQRKFDAARRYLEAAISSDAKNYKAYYEYAYLLSREGRDEFGMGKDFSKETADKIRVAVRKAIALNPSYTRSYDMFAYISLNTGEQLDEAATLLQNALKYKPGDELTLIRLAEIYLRQQKLDEAEATAIKLAKRTDDEDIRSRANQLASNIRQMREYEDRRTKAMAQRDGEKSGSTEGARPILKRGPVQTITSADMERVKAESINRSINENLRTGAATEQRVVGRVQKVECKRGQITFSVVSGDKPLLFTSKDFVGLHLMVFTGAASRVNVGCGADLSKFKAVISYEPKGTGGEITALEFVPDEFTLLTAEQLAQGPPTYVMAGGSGDLPTRIEERRVDEDKKEEAPKSEEEMRRNAAIEHIRSNLSEPQAGEKREFGYLDKIECGEQNVFFHLRTATRKFKLLNDQSMQPGIRLFTPDLEGMRFGCGIKPVDFPVVFVYKENPPKKKGDGTVVSLEFVPKSFTLN